MTETTSTDMLEGMTPPGSLAEMYQLVLKKIAELDAVLDSAIDPKTAGRVKMKNNLIDDTKPQYETSVKSIIEQINAISDERTRYGFYFGIAQALSENFESKFDQYIDHLVKSQPKVGEVEKPSEEKLEKAREQRKTFYNNAKTLREMALTFQQGNASDFPEPKKLTGRTGPRGERAITSFNWFINGEPAGEDSDSLAKIAAKYDADIPKQEKKWTGRDGVEKVKQLSTLASLRALIAKANGLDDLSDPGDVLNYTIKPGVVLMGKKVTADDVAQPAEDENEDENDESEEAEVQQPV